MGGKDRLMGRGVKSTKGKAEATRAPAGTSPKDEGAKVRDLEKRLAEALQREQVLVEQQAATAKILSVISSSPTDVQPVFDTITQNALELCGAASSLLTTFDGELLHLAALANVRPGVADSLRRVYPMRPGRGAAGARAILTRAVVHIPDLREDPEYALRDLVQALDFRSVLAVPMLREGKPIGTINVHKGDPEPFSESQIALLQTFAAQAVIAIENARLFKELEARNTELTTSLDTQTATSDILRVISSSPTDVQPVFDAIAHNARRLCEAGSAQVVTYDGELMWLQSLDHISPEHADALRGVFPLAPHTGSAAGRAILTGAPVHIPDLDKDRDYSVRSVVAAGLATVLAVPMLRDGSPIGTVNVHIYGTPRPFSDKQTTLLQTFADQAVIAVENVRLFTELQARTQELTRSVGELRALGEVGQAISSTLDLQTVLSTIAARATQLAGADAGVIYEYDAEREVFEPRATEHLEPEIVDVLVTAPVRKGEGATGQLAISPQAVQLSDIHLDSLPSLHHARGAFVRAGSERCSPFHCCAKTT